MNPQLLNRPYVGIMLSTPDYAKVSGQLPTPSYQDVLISHDEKKIILVFALDGYITSAKQYKWLSDIKLGLKEYLFVKFEDVEEFFVHLDTVINGNTYSLEELAKAFKIKYRQYPSILYAENEKSLYRHLLIHGKKLRHRKLFTLEAMISAALMMNSKLKVKVSHRSLHKKVISAYKFIIENKENFPERLSRDELTTAHKRGAISTHKKRTSNTENKIFEALASGDYFKANGEINKSALAEALGMNRKTISKYLKSIAL